MAQPSSSSAPAASASSYFDQVSGKWAYEDPVTGNTLEWDAERNVWVPVVSHSAWLRSVSPRLVTRIADCVNVTQVEDDLIRAQQAAYSVAGVDEEVSLS